jgi:hypothetical protein
MAPGRSESDCARERNLGSPIQQKGKLGQTATEFIRGCAQSSIHDDKDVSPVHDVPVAALSTPIAIPVRAPVGMVPIVVRVNCRSVSSTHCGSTRTVDHLSSVRYLRRCGDGAE